MRRIAHRLPLVAAGAAMALGGCATPFAGEKGDQVLQKRIAAAIDREIAGLPPDSKLRETTTPVPEVQETLADRMPELDKIGPQIPFAHDKLDIGPDLTGAEQSEAKISLQSAITSAVRNNFSVQIARLQPAINEADVVIAEAMFDAVFFAGADLNWSDEPSIVPAVGGVPLSNPALVQQQYRFETGVRKLLTTGGEVTLSTGLNRFEDNSPGGVTFFPDPAYNAAINLGIRQPLLRGFGTAVNTASIRLARNLQRSAIEQLRADLLATLDATEAAYWDLVFAWDDLEIREWLVDVGIEVRDIMGRRRDFDTKPAEYSDAVATVEQRKANVISARRAIRAASDKLKTITNDPHLAVGSETLLVPVDVMVEQPIRYSMREAMVTAVANRPEVQQAILGIDDASIREMVASNARLPLLDLTLGMSYAGQYNSGSGAYNSLLSGSFISYAIGVLFESPIGNRAAQAGYRQSRLQRSASVIAYQSAIQQVVLDVKSSLRDCVTNYELITANRSNRIAQAENLRTLRVEEETLAGLTPEFLNLKFQRQERLAAAERELVGALVNYNKAVASLYRAMGVGLAMNRIDLEIVGDEDGQPQQANAPSADSNG